MVKRKYRSTIMLVALKGCELEINKHWYTTVVLCYEKVKWEVGFRAGTCITTTLLYASFECFLVLSKLFTS